MLKQMSQGLAGRALTVLLLLASLAALLWLALFLVTPRGSHQTLAGAAPNAPTGDTPPWGRLERLRIAVERPTLFISMADGFALQTRWFFGGSQPGDLEAFLRGLKLPPPVLSPLLNQANWVQDARGIWVPTTTEIVLGLTPEARQTLYPILAQFRENFAQSGAFRFRQDAEREWFANSGLSPTTLALVKERYYRSGNALCFADLGEVATKISSSAERLALLKALSRESTLLVKLHVDDQTDVARLIRYWGRRGRAKDLEPLLESLKRIPGGASIDISHLLPPFARMRLYTYPLPVEDQVERKQDCYWTAFNFFHEPPEDRYGDAASVKGAFAKDYFVVQDAPTFGDIILLTNERGMTIHAAVYIADDIVFTKNGNDFVHPWILMESADLMAVYTIKEPPRVIVYRLKDSD